MCQVAAEEDMAVVPIRVVAVAKGAEVICEAPQTTTKDLQVAPSQAQEGIGETMDGTTAMNHPTYSVGTMNVSSAIPDLEETTAKEMVTITNLIGGMVREKDFRRVDNLSNGSEVRKGTPSITGTRHSGRDIDELTKLILH